MKILFDPLILQTTKSETRLPLECEWCHTTFYIKAKWLKSDIKRKVDRHKYCRPICHALSSKRRIKDNCGNCNKELFIQPSQKRKSKSGKSFCSRSCRAIYNNTHKTTGIRRSKLEIWLEQELLNSFKELNIIFNNKETINSELDIYIPSLKIAFELNGIFHYEPIYGADKLSAIQNNDGRKFQACLEQGIELVIIDSSTMKNFKPNKAQRYLDIISGIILQKQSAGEKIRTFNTQVV